jgi:uncharacterized protein
MEAETPPAEVSVPRARPVDISERIVLLDVLRGFALGGVFVSNFNLWFSGLIFLPPDQIKPMLSDRWNAVAGHVFSFLGFGKFMTIFSCLFGLGFAVQMLRAEERGDSVVPVYARRLGILLAIGLAHLLGLWLGDILTLYALMGFGLFVFRRRSDRALIIWSLILTLAVPLAVNVGERYLPGLFRSKEATEAAEKAATAEYEAIRTAVLAGMKSDSYFTMLRSNAAYVLHDLLSPRVIGLLSLILGKFLLGLYAGRRRLFENVAEHRAFFRRLLIWGLVIGGVTSGGMAAVRYFTINQRLSPTAWWRVAMPTLKEIGFLGLAMAYVAIMTLLFQRPLWRRILSILAPAGRMALTNYLLQSVIGLLTFYGFGLGFVGQWGPARCITVGLGLFAVQVALSHVWLAFFRFGPMEWVWRSLTYGKAQPMLISRHPPAVAGAQASEAKAG